MARHHGAAQPRQIRTEMPPAASFLAPIVIFSIALFAVYQVNHHTQLESMITTQELETQDHHFVTGGREAQESGKRDITLSGNPPPHGQGTPISRGGDAASSTVLSPVISSGSGSGGGTLPRKVIADAGDREGAARRVDGTDGTQGAAVDPALVKDCHVVEHVEYPGQVVKWGDKHITQTGLECCNACKAEPGCNVWVWCAAEQCAGGTNPRVRGECWLKKSTLNDVMTRNANPGIPWTSGALYTAAVYTTWQQQAKDKEQAEVNRLKALREREDLPLVWLEVTLKGQVIGRMEFVLFTDIAPLAAENMRRMCTGEVSPKHTLKGAYFYRIIDQFIDQTGVDIEPCALGGMFKDDPEGLKLQHDRKGLLSVANMGHDTNTGHFSILQAPAPHLNKNYVIFGELVSGWEVAHAVNKLSIGKPNNELLYSKDALISDVGQIRRGKPVSEEVIKAGLVNKATQR